MSLFLLSAFRQSAKDSMSRSSRTYLGKLGQERLKENMRRRSECNIHMPRSFGHSIEELSAIQCPIQEEKPRERSPGI
ncbi:hypothetical protein TNCV_3874111 [Trichonephila clavipes]|nr:hypothetical protein TNCV_3874111 [Trichonephila clavipes]